MGSGTKPMIVTSSGNLDAESPCLNQWDYYFNHHERRYKLFKVRDSAQAPYLLHFQHGQKRRRCSLETNNPEIAEHRARILIDRAIDDHWRSIRQPNLLPPDHPSSSLAAVIEAYRAVATISPRVAKTNVLALLKILERVNGERRDPAKVSLSAINKGLASGFQDEMVRRYCADAPKDDPAQREARERALRSTRSTIQQARSMFSRKGQQDLIERYQERGIIIPKCVEEFGAAKLRGKLHKSDYRVPSDAIIQRTFEAIEEKKDDVSLYLAFWLGAGAGLRRKEIQFCLWEHLVNVDGVLWVAGGLGKNGQQIRVPVQLRAAQAIAPFRSTGWVIPERGDRWAKRLCAWMRGLGWETDKLLHELRAYCGSLLYEKNPLSAMRFLRHSSIAVTERNYVRYGSQSSPIQVL